MTKTIDDVVGANCVTDFVSSSRARARAAVAAVAAVAAGRNRHPISFLGRESVCQLPIKKRTADYDATRRAVSECGRAASERALAA